MQQHIPYDLFFAVDGLLPFDEDDILNFAGPRRKKLLLKHYTSSMETIDRSRDKTRQITVWLLLNARETLAKADTGSVWVRDSDGG